LIYKATFEVFTRAGPDNSLERPTERSAEGDKVVTRMSGSGTHRGELFGTAPTGKQASGVRCIFVAPIANGKLVEDTVVYDTLGMLRQLGVVPSIAEKGGIVRTICFTQARSYLPRKRVFFSEIPLTPGFQWKTTGDALWSRPSRQGGRGTPQMFRG
jgi:hypothetical protein